MGFGSVLLRARWGLGNVVGRSKGEIALLRALTPIPCRCLARVSLTLANSDHL